MGFGVLDGFPVNPIWVETANIYGEIGWKSESDAAVLVQAAEALL
jgi:hypothetical protein